MLVILFLLQGDQLYNYYYLTALDPSKIYYKNLITNTTDLTNIYETTDIYYYLNKSILPNYFSERQLAETSNIWVGPMLIRQVN